VGDLSFPTTSRRARYRVHCLVVNTRICTAVGVPCDFNNRQRLFPYTYLLTPWSRVLLEMLTGSQLLKKFPAFYGTRRFITAYTSARHLSLS